MYSRRDVTRGFASSEILSYDKWTESGPRPYGPFERWHYSTRFEAPVDNGILAPYRRHALAYPLPTSFPRSIIPSQSVKPRQPKGIFSRSPSTTVLSSLATTTHTGSLLRRYATFIESFVKRKLDLGSIGASIEMDEVKELNSELWTVVDNYGGGVGDGGAGEGEGEGEGEGV